jgi:hypothetical protein
MTQTRVFHLSNPSLGQEFDLTVADGADPLAAARAHLEESGLYGDSQQGFSISVYPRSPEGDAPTSTQSTTEVGPSADSGTIDDAAILA